jgi:GTP cyclohydrolase I
MTVTDQPVDFSGVVVDVALTADSAEPDMIAAEMAADQLLAALQIPRDTESLAATPARLARALREIVTPAAFTATTFPNDENYNQLVIQCDIPFRSICEHHMLAFTGVAHVGYMPGPRILGLSKLARLVQHFAARPQVQERLTQQVADWLQTNLHAEGVGVVMSAEHTCMTLRGVRAGGARTVTSAMHGVLRADPSARNEFMTLISLK